LFKNSKNLRPPFIELSMRCFRKYPNPFQRRSLEIRRAGVPRLKRQRGQGRGLKTKQNKNLKP